MDVDSSIRTRSRAKQQAEQWQMVPLPAKLLSLLTDTVSESRAQKAAGTWPALHGLAPADVLFSMLRVSWSACTPHLCCGAAVAVWRLSGV